MGVKMIYDEIARGAIDFLEEYAKEEKNAHKVEQYLAEKDKYLKPFWESINKLREYNEEKGEDNENCKEENDALNQCDKEPESIQKKFDAARISRVLKKIRSSMFWINFSPINHFIRKGDAYAEKYYIWLLCELDDLDSELPGFKLSWERSRHNFDSLLGLVRGAYKVIKQKEKALSKES